MENQTELLTALNQLRSEIKSLRTEMNRVEETVLRERFRTIEETLTKNHLKVYAKQRTERLNKEIDKMLKQGCENREKCSQKCRAIIESNTQTLKEKSSKDAITDIETTIAENTQMVQKTKGYPCEDCFKNFDKILKNERRAFGEIVLVENSNTQPSQDTLNIPLLIEDWIEPVSNDARLKVLDKLYQGKKSFSELSKDLGIKAGHLTFHLRKLTAAKLIAQEASKGDYIITEKGLRLIKKMLSLQAEDEK